MANYGLSYDLASLKGYAQLQKRLAAVGAFDKTLMRDLGVAAVREQKRLLYTQAVTRRTGHSGQLVTLGAVSASSALTEARGTAAWADTGTKPHIITPKAARVLAWASSASGRRLTGATRKGVKAANMVFAMVVHHPGTKAHPYMVRGAQEAIRQAGLADKVIAAWNRSA
jgi:hypothetical protein